MKVYISKGKYYTSHGTVLIACTQYELEKIEEAKLFCPEKLTIINMDKIDPTQKIRAKEYTF